MNSNPGTSLDIVFDKPPGPGNSVFQDVEIAGKSLSVGEWVKLPTGDHALRLTRADLFQIVDKLEAAPQ